jgi:hypothetical protein
VSKFLSKVTTGKDTSHGVILGIYGEPGSGKTSLALDVPGILLVDAERSAAHYEARRFSPDRWDDVLGITQEFWADQSAGQAIGFDSLDAIQAMVFDQVARANGVEQSAKSPMGGGSTRRPPSSGNGGGFSTGSSAKVGLSFGPVTRRRPRSRLRTGTPLTGLA